MTPDKQYSLLEQNFEFSHSLDPQQTLIRGATWNGIPNINLGGDSVTFSDTGQATVTCAVDCINGDLFTLDYTAHYHLMTQVILVVFFWVMHLEGTVSAVPVPAAVWLFGSGLISLIGIARRKKA